MNLLLPLVLLLILCVNWSKDFLLVLHLPPEYSETIPLWVVMQISKKTQGAQHGVWCMVGQVCSDWWLLFWLRPRWESLLSFLSSFPSASQSHWSHSFSRGSPHSLTHCFTQSLNSSTHLFIHTLIYFFPPSLPLSLIDSSTYCVQGFKLCTERDQKTVAVFSTSSLSPRGDEKSFGKIGRLWRVEMIEHTWLQ